MQIWQLFIILKQPVALSVTVFSNPTKLTKNKSVLTSSTSVLSFINGWIISEQNRIGDGTGNEKSFPLSLP